MSIARYLWQMILYRPGLYAANLVLWAIVHLSPLALGLIVREFFDSLAGTSATGLSVEALIAVLLGYTLARITLMAGGALTDIRHRFSMKALVTANTFERLLERPGVTAMQDTVGEAISRFREDVHQIEDSVSWLLDSFGQGLFAAGSLVIMVQVNARVALVTFVPLILVVTLSRLASQRVEEYRRASRAAASDAVGALGEVFTAVQSIKLGVAEERAAAHVRRLNERRRQLQLRDRMVTEVLQSVYYNAVSVGTGLILLLAAGAMRTGEFTVGDFSLFAYYLGFVTDFTWHVGMMLVHLRQTSVSFGRLAELLQGGPLDRLVRHSPIHLDQEPPPVPALPAVRQEGDRLQELRVDRLTCTYPRTSKGIRDVSLTLRRGGFVVVTGRVGAGKTTLLRGILGLMEHQSGGVCWNGCRVDDPRTFFGPPRSAYTPQVPTLFSDSLKGNVLMGWPDEPDDLARALRLAALERDLAAMPAGLETVVGARGLKLSGGQQQRVAAARMLLRRADLLVIDDLSSAVDVETEAAIWEGLFAEPNLTCLVVSHRRAALRRADQVILMDQGRIADRGSLSELLARSPQMREIWGVE